MAEIEKKEIWRKRIMIYGITAGCAAIVSLLYDFSVSLFSLHDVGQIIGLLSNSFAVPGVLLLGMSGLIFVKRQGGFDGLSYSVRYTFNWLFPQVWLNKDEYRGKMQNYRDYCEKKRERERGRTNLTVCFLIVGAAFTSLGIIFLIAMNVWFPETSLEAF